MDYRLSRKILWIGIDTGMVLLAASMCFKNEKIQVYNFMQIMILCI